MVVKKIISVLKEGTLDNGIKAATDVIGGLGDDAVKQKLENLVVKTVFK